MQGDIMTRQRDSSGRAIAWRGFSLIEMLIVITIMGVLFALALPRLKSFQAGEKMRSAKSQLLAVITTAQSTAVRRGRWATIKIAQDSAWIYTDSSGTKVNIARRALPFGTQYGAVLTYSQDTIRYDLRGIPVGLAATQKFVITIGAKKDSICISKFGMLLTQGCAL